MNKVLVIATSSKTRGGITSVIRTHREANFWKEWNCTWIETHRDSSLIIKLFYLSKSFAKFLFFLPNTSLIHCHLSANSSVKRKYPFLVIAKWFRKPIIIHFHAFSAESRIDINYKNLYNKVFKMADKLIVLSESWKKGIHNDLDLDCNKVKVVYNPCPIVSSDLELKKEKFILYAGTLKERKGYANLIKAFAVIAEEHHDWSLVLAGNGEIEEGKAIAKKLNVDKKVIFKGWVSGKEKHELFSKASIFCLPSYAEGFPMAVLDAWAYGLPVITTPVGGIPDVGVDGLNMFLFEPNDIKNLVVKIDNLIKDRSLQAKFREASLQFARSKFSISQIGIQLDNIYRSV